MSLANKLLSLLNESSSNDQSQEDISEAKKSDFAGMSLPEYFSGVFGSDLNTIDISLDESEDGSGDLYVDTTISTIPFSFRFYLENNEQPMLDILSWNEVKDESVQKSIKLPKRMINSVGDFVIEENLHNLPAEKISEAVEKMFSLVEVLKLQVRNINGKTVVKKVNVSASDLAKKAKYQAKYQRTHKSQIAKASDKRDRKPRTAEEVAHLKAIRKAHKDKTPVERMR